MLILEQVMEIKILHRQGKSLRKISRETGLSVNTVRKYIEASDVRTYKKRASIIRKLDPYKDYLEDRVKSAYPLWLPATVLFMEIKAQGYKGGITQLRVYLSGLRPCSTEEESVVRFETLPGEQMQVDWIVLRKGKDPLSAFVATLGFSRASYVQFVNNEKLEALLNCHMEAFEYFGGVPKEVLYDNMKTVITERDAYGIGKHRFNIAMLDFAKHYGFRLRVCRPYWAKTKGKVERFNRYLRYSFYNPLVSQLKAAGLSLDLETANIKVLKWLRDVANVRLHGTTKSMPTVKLKEEKDYLQVLPKPYCGKVKVIDVAEGVKVASLQTSINPLQHPLSVYQQILEAL